MKPIYLLADILFPLLCGAMLPLFVKKPGKALRLTVGGITGLTSLFTWALILFASAESIDIISFTRDFSLTLSFDGLGRFFAGLVSTLWPLTTLYAFEYLDDDPRPVSFYAFFTMAYGVTLGISMAGDLFTLYIFYELLTLTTVPLVLHTMTREAVRAGITYFGFSLGGAAFALLSMLYLANNGPANGSLTLTRLFYVFGFFGFGVKSAVFPLHRWLPKASVAPTPVTALLHAVAVVNSGVFAVLRLIYYFVGAEVLSGTMAQSIAMGFTCVTIVYGSLMAL